TGRRRVFIAVSILKGSRCGMQFWYHERAALRDVQAETPRKLYDLRPEDVVHVDDTNGPASLIHDHQAGDLPGLHHLQRFCSQIVGADHLWLATGHLAGREVIDRPCPQVEPPEVAVGDHAREPTFPVDDGRHAFTLLRHLDDDLPQARRLAADR